MAWYFAAIAFCGGDGRWDCTFGVRGECSHPDRVARGGELMPVPRYRSRNLRGRVMFADCPFSAWAVSLFEI